MFPTAGIVAGLIAGVAVLDLSIKEYVEKHIEPGERRWLPGKAAVLKKVYNRGFALDTLDRHPRIVKSISALMCAVCLTFAALLSQKKEKTVSALGMSLIAGGAISNTWDRLKKGYVVDYLSFRTRITYNLGDFAIFAGAILLLIESIAEERRK